MCRMLGTSRLLYSIFFCKQKTAYEMRISDWSSDVCSSDLSWLALNPILPSRPEQSMANPPASARGDVSFSEYMKSTSPRRPTRHLGSLAMSQTSKGCDLRRSRHD